MRFATSKGDSYSRPLIDNQYTVWNQENTASSADATAQQCSSTLPLAIQLPSKTMEGLSGGDPIYLPPSYDLAFPGVPELFVKVTYTLSVVVTRHRGKRLSFLVSDDL